MNQAIFKAYDIRGKYPNEVNEGIVARVVEIMPSILKKGSVVVGHDARLSSPALYKSALKAFRENGAGFKAVPAGMITTPMLYFLVNRHKAAGGIMITASHNPKEYNGLKVVGPGALPISGTEIKNLVFKKQF